MAIEIGSDHIEHIEQCVLARCLWLVCSCGSLWLEVVLMIVADSVEWVRMQNRGAINQSINRTERIELFNSGN